MRTQELLTVASIVLGAIGTWLMLPHRHGSSKPRNVHIAGFALAVLAVLLLMGLFTPPGPILLRLFFYAFSIAAVLGGILMVTSRNPVYSALWFAAVVLSTAGLFLEAGAQFLAAGTVIVYAGAIIVTFLFVIMLAQSTGQALYDRTARSPARATLACFLLLWTLIYALVAVKSPTGEPLAARTAPDRLFVTARLADAPGLRPGTEVAAVVDQAVRADTARIITPTAKETPEGVPVPHVAGLGATLYTDHLITIEVVGAILFVALVGAVAIATPKPPMRPVTGGR